MKILKISYLAYSRCTLKDKCTLINKIRKMNFFDFILYHSMKENVMG
jgi:hypothetical protein